MVIIPIELFEDYKTMPLKSKVMYGILIHKYFEKFKSFDENQYMILSPDDLKGYRLDICFKNCFCFNSKQMLGRLKGTNLIKLEYLQEEYLNKLGKKSIREKAKIHLNYFNWIDKITDTKGVSE